MSSDPRLQGAFTLEPGCRIQVVLPDDGTDRRLLEGLWRDRGIARADTVAVKAVAALQKAKARRGRLPEPMLSRLVTLVVDPADADAVFEYVCATANIGRPGGGMVLADRLLGATTCVFPPGLPDVAV
jgi:hypothetical protein